MRVRRFMYVPTFCDCKHERDGWCHRYPKVSITVLGKNVWTYPPADCECGERAPREVEKAPSTNTEDKQPSDGARAAVKHKRKAKGAE